MAKCFHVQVLQNLLSDATARTTNQNTKKGKMKFNTSGNNVCYAEPLYVCY